MGTVYLAEDTHLGRRVAIKFPSVNSDSHDYRARFLREARAVSELSHPGIATLFDYGETDEGRPFLVMELARGRPLNELMQKGELNLARAVAIVTDVATALGAAHARGVIHRDIKPSNIMIDDDGQVKVLDFGLAKQLNKESGGASEPEARTLLSTETRSGVVLGTPAYLSPEQATSGAVDGRSDLFALGTLLYEAITGRTPFAGNSFIEIAANVLHVEPPPPSRYNSMVPRELNFITLKCLAKKPSKRYQSSKELVADLSSIKDSLEETSGQTLIRRTSPSIIAAPSRTLNNLSQILQRPRIPISYILIGLAVLIVGGVVAFRFLRPAPHVPTAEAQRWYEIGTAALRDGAYYQASQAFQRSVAADDDYLLAHARYAEALVELDYVDQAKDELLRVNAADRAKVSTLDSLYLDAIIATARHDYARSTEFYKQIIEQVSEAEKPHVLVDLGNAYDKNQDLKNAVAAYAEATTRNPQYGTAFLRLGILYGRQRKLEEALASFDKAEAIYQALGNLEGRTEVVYQRGTLFNQLNNLAEARAQLERALALAKAGEQTSQLIKVLLQLSTVSVDAGESNRATDYAHEAVELAQKKGMENLSAQGLVDLGYAFLIRGDYGETEKYLLQALESAQRAKARNNEARARSALASLREQQNRPDEVVSYLEPALAFYEQGGYRSEAFACLSLLARAHLQKGDYAAADKGHEQLLQLAGQSNDQSQVARAHAERAQGLLREEKFSEALDHFIQAYDVYSSQGVQRSMGFSLLGRAEALSSLGRYSEAQTMLDQAAAIADKPDSVLKQLSLQTQLVAAEMALSQGKFADAQGRANKVFASADKEFPDVALEALTLAGLAQADGGGAAAAKKLLTDAVNRAYTLNDPAQRAAAQLSLAEALAIGGETGDALAQASQAQETFKQLGQEASRWRALLLQASTSEKLGDKNAAREYALQAKESLAKLEQRWGSENYQTYLSRPDVQRYRKQLDQLGL
jgi:tetratricopeptide (TPR) repeat protein